MRKPVVLGTLAVVVIGGVLGVVGELAVWWPSSGGVAAETGILLGREQAGAYFAVDGPAGRTTAVLAATAGGAAAAAVLGGLGFAGNRLVTNRVQVSAAPAALAIAATAVVIAVAGAEASVWWTQQPVTFTSSSESEAYSSTLSISFGPDWTGVVPAAATGGLIAGVLLGGVAYVVLRARSAPRAATSS